MAEPMHISEVLDELVGNWPILAMPDYSGRASCIECRGQGERGVRREQETNEWVTVPCPACNGTGDFVPSSVLCPSCGHDQYDHAPDNLPPYTCTLLGCRCSRTPDHLLVDVPEVA